MGAFKVFPWATALAAFGVVLAAGYILWMIERVFFGPQRPRFSSIGDAQIVEAIPLGILALTIVVIGLYPGLLTDVFKSGVEPITRLVDLMGVSR